MCERSPSRYQHRLSSVQTDSLIVIAVLNGQLILWDFQTQKIRRQIDHQMAFPAIALSLDGKTLLSVASTDNRGDLKFWGIETGKQVALQKNTQNRRPNNTPPSEYRCLFQLVAAPLRFGSGMSSQKTERAQFPVDGQCLFLGI